MKFLKVVTILFLCCGVLQPGHLKADSRSLKNQLNAKHVFGPLQDSPVRFKFYYASSVKIINNYFFLNTLKKLDYKKILAMKFEPQKPKKGEKAP